MRIFKKLFGRSSDPSIDDPVFGRMMYRSGIWTALPQASADAVLVTVDAPAAGPSQQQREMFLRVERGLQDLAQQARDYVRRQSEQGPDVGELRLYSIEIGADDDVEAERFVLELSDTNEIVIHRVSFAFGRPVHYTYDS